MPTQDMIPTPLADGPRGSGKPGFLSSPAGKVVVIGAALAVLLVVLGAVAAIVLFTLGKQTETALTASVTSPPPRPVSAISTGSTEPTAAPRVIIPVSNRDIFTARDPFEPVIESTETIGGDFPAEYDTLTLQNIVTVGGANVAVLTFNGVTYVAGVGQRLGNTAWQVLSVGSDSVTMLYGDVQVTLTVGEGVAK